MSFFRNREVNNKNKEIKLQSQILQVPDRKETEGKNKLEGLDKFKNKEVNEYDTVPKFSEKSLFNNENKKIEKGKQKGIDRFQDKNPEQQRKIIDGQADTIKQYKEKLNNVKNKVDSDEGKGQREREIEFDR